MNVALSQELEKRLTEKVERGEIQSADGLVEQAVAFWTTKRAQWTSRSFAKPKRP